MSFEFLWWPLFFLAPLPFIARRMMPEAHQGRFISLRMFATPWLSRFGKPYSPPQHLHQKILAWCIWGLLLLAAARPEFIGDPVRLETESPQLLLAVDLSESMLEEDMVIQREWVTRLDAARAVIAEFIREREGDRIGLIVFGTRAYLLTPYTDDHVTLKTLLFESEAGMAGPKTAIGDAIGLAAKHAGDDNQRKVLILLTDGRNTAGNLDPLQASAIAKDNNMVIYPVGLGGGANKNSGMLFELLSRRSFSGGQINDGVMKKIAELTSGQYFRASDTEELMQIYNYLNDIEPSNEKPKFYRPRKGFYHWPLTIALLLMAAGLALQLMSSQLPDVTIARRKPSGSDGEHRSEPTIQSAPPKGPPTKPTPATPTKRAPIILGKQAPNQNNGGQS